jgi:hypothetical protein
VKFLSHVWSIARGSVGGITYTANQFGQLIARVKTSPVHPNTTRQGQVKQAFSGAAVAWKALSDQERIDWQSYADSLTYSNPLGPIDMPGRQTMMGNIGFMNYLLAREFVFTTQLFLAPVIPGFLTMDPLSVTAPGAPGTGFDINVGNFNASDIKVIFELSRRFDGSRNRFQGPWQTETLQELDVGAGQTGNLNFEVGADDQVFFVRIRAIVDDGPKQVSQEVILRAVVQTTSINGADKIKKLPSGEKADSVKKAA